METCGMIWIKFNVNIIFKKIHYNNMCSYMPSDFARFWVNIGCSESEPVKK
jgi:hypothetical protein